MEYQNKALRIIGQEILDAVDLHTEAIYETKRPQMVGEKMVRAELAPTQLRGLENLVLSTRRFSEIINYIKNQAGKDRKGQWSQVAIDLLGQLEDLEKKAKEIGKGDPATTLDVKMRLARGWVKQIVAHYLFTSSLEKGHKDAS